MRPEHTLAELLRDWTWIARADRCAHIDAPGARLTFAALRRLYMSAGKVVVDGERTDVASAWLEHPHRKTVTSVIYNPQVPAGIVMMSDEKFYLNCRC